MINHGHTSISEDYKEETIKVLTKGLKKDGFEFNGSTIVPIGKVDFEQIKETTSILDKVHFQEQIERIKKSIDSDPELAIGSAKELIESTLKTILTELSVSYNRKDDIPKLLKETQKALKLVPSDIDDAIKGANIIKTLLSNLGQVVLKLNELRNLYGTGHGREKKKGLNERHARLAVGSSITLCNFLLETYEYRKN